MLKVFIIVCLVVFLPSWMLDLLPIPVLTAVRP
jgi:hypothetical protein